MTVEQPFEMFPKNQKGIVEVSQDWYDNHIKALAHSQEEINNLKREMSDIQGHIDHADAYHKAMEKAEAEVASFKVAGYRFKQGSVWNWYVSEEPALKAAKRHKKALQTIYVKEDINVEGN